MVRVVPSGSMGITLPITMGLPMGVTWPVTPPMTSIHIGGIGGGNGQKRATPNKSSDSGFSDSEAPPCPRGVRGHQGVSLVCLAGREEEHYQSPSFPPFIKVANQEVGDRKKKGGERRNEEELSGRCRGSPDVPTETRTCNEETGKEVLLQEYSKSTPPSPDHPPSISRSASISLPSSPVFSNFSKTPFQNFSETSSRSGGLDSGSSATR